MLPAGLCLRAVLLFIAINPDSEMVNDDTSRPGEQLAVGCPERERGDAGTDGPTVPGPFAINCQLYRGTDLP